ncbi:Hypothetical_protein [Hexamita inflata]|uniref:Hypothetical_protein n=1 Tax=Hexamita inflata TaxID=28002 RepID=A0AA86NP92_9EUKA|nr:Hypothetical protein HINF_LOCUS10166 [Hexamita inflata]
MISQVCEFTNIISIAMSGVSLKIKLKITIVSSTVIKFLFSLLNRYSIRVIPEQPVQERLPSSHTTQLGELLKSLFLASFLLQIIIIWLSLPTKLSEGSRASEFIQVFNLVWLSESYFGDQIHQRSENIDFSQKFTDITKNINIQQQVLQTLEDSHYPESRLKNQLWSHRLSVKDSTKYRALQPNQKDTLTERKGVFK